MNYARSGALILVLLLAQAQNDLSEALKALDANQPAVAEPLLRKAVEADSHDVQAQFDLALVLGMLGKDSESIAAYRKTLELRPGLYEAELNLGILLLRDRQPAEAALVLKPAAEAKPGEFRPQFFYAEALLDGADYEHAEQQFRAALAIDAKSAAANVGLGRALLRAGKLTESEAPFRTAAALDPAQKNALLELGIEYDKQQKTDQAIAIFREFPANDAVAKRLSEILLRTHNAAAAIPTLEAMVQRVPTTANRLNLADAYRIAGQTAKVIGQLQLAVAADGSNFDLRMMLGRVLRDNRQFPAAAREFQAAAGLTPDSVAALNEWAGVLILAGQLDEGLEVLDKVRATGKEIPGDVYLRAITLDKLHRNKPALEAYRQFLSLAGGKFPDDEFKARQRVRIIETELGK